jgi:hypothetical protein
LAVGTPSSEATCDRPLPVYRLIHPLDLLLNSQHCTLLLLVAAAAGGEPQHQQQAAETLLTDHRHSICVKPVHSQDWQRLIRPQQRFSSISSC